MKARLQNTRSSTAWFEEAGRELHWGISGLVWMKTPAFRPGLKGNHLPSGALHVPRTSTGATARVPSQAEIVRAYRRGNPLDAVG